MLYEYFY